MTKLDQFIAEHCHVYPTAAVKLQTLCEVFRQSLAANEKADWPRHAIVAALRVAGFAVARGSDKTMHVAGISLQPAPSWRVEAGRLRLVKG